MKGNRTNHPNKWMRWSDWESWLLKEWLPFKTNDLPHLIKEVDDLVTAQWWLRVMIIFTLTLLGLILALLGIMMAKGG